MAPPARAGSYDLPTRQSGAILLTSSTVAALGERQLIERIRQHLPQTSPDFVTEGIGDDAAVLAPERGAETVVTTDVMVEGIHFRRDWTSARAIGHKALAVNLSDLAAMGATPRATLLSLVLPSSYPVSDFDELVTGFLALAERTGTALIGGNLARSPGPLIVDVTAIGVVRKRRILSRRGALAGHRLYVTGHVGAAAAGLHMLQSGRTADALTLDEAACVQHHHMPEPRLRFARIVAKTAAASACIDLSDGLADAATRLAEAGEVSVVLDPTVVPVHPGARTWFATAGRDPLQAAIVGGEDYELAFAVAPRQERRFLAAARRCPDLPVCRIGIFEPGSGVWLTRAGERVALDAQTFDHF